MLIEVIYADFGLFGVFGGVGGGGWLGCVLVGFFSWGGVALYIVASTLYEFKIQQDSLNLYTNLLFEYYLHTLILIFGSL